MTKLTFAGVTPADLKPLVQLEEKAVANAETLFKILKGIVAKYARAGR